MYGKSLIYLAGLEVKDPRHFSIWEITKREGYMDSDYPLRAGDFMEMGEGGRSPVAMRDQLM